MKKFILIILSIIVVSAPGISQKATEDDIVNISKISFPDFGYSYELRVGKFKSLVGAISLNPRPQYSGFPILGDNYSINLSPTLNLSYRKYYNFNQRSKKHKRTSMNSLNYYSPILQSSYTQDNFKILDIHISGKDNNIDPMPSTVQSSQSFNNTIAFVWGIQRNYNNRFSLDVSTGLALINSYTKTTYTNGNTFSSNLSTVTPVIQVSLGVWLNKVK
ncbi:MAG: hypothetical protein QM539_02700 [Alphaproteobacteria bacterium]|nr:hypothetical protein [Alphaproteobacteria bacterium]